jgi:hypothetical protein
MPLNKAGKWEVDEAQPDLWLYTDAESFTAGDTVAFRGSCTMRTEATLTVTLDGSVPRPVYASAPFAVDYTPAPEQAFASGCDWPVVFELPPIPDGWPSGFYIVTATTAGGEAVGEHFFVVRPTTAVFNRLAGSAGELLLLLSTNTWRAYNDWGGASAYEGVREGNLAAASNPETGMAIPFEDLMRGAHHLSFHRPISPGFITVHSDAPRAALPEQMPIRGTEAYDAFRQRQRDRRVHAAGLTTFYFATGWAMYERHFALWAVANGYTVHYATNLDLHQQGADMLRSYKCCVSVGHDEYWSAAMRRAADGFTSDGGQWARFAGNFMWQIRLEADPEDSARVHQVCYKYDYTADPVYGTDRQDELTFVWDASVVGWPGVHTFGLNASRGLYARLSTCTPRNTGGFTVFRADNPIFAGTSLQYGDVFGNEVPIFGYEVDGLSFTLDSDGLPRPTGEDGAPTDGSLQILALGLACNAGMLGDQRLIAMSRYGNASQESVDLAAMGAQKTPIKCFRLFLFFPKWGPDDYVPPSCLSISGIFLRRRVDERQGTVCWWR